MDSNGTDTDVKIKSAVLIQKWFRRYRARLNVRRRVAWIVYQSIEYSSEARRSHLHKFFQEMLSKHVKTESKTVQASKSASTGMSFYDRLQEFGDRDDKEFEKKVPVKNLLVETKNYSGPNLNFPLSSMHVFELIENFKVDKQLHYKYLVQLLHEVRLLLKSRPNIQKFSTSISKKVTVVGDLHGHLDDLLIIFDKNGLPDVTNPYVFNGDFVDCGKMSVEVAVLLFACLLVWPTSVFLNRGNHEDHVVNVTYGLEAEVGTKYGEYKDHTLRLFSEVFSWLPLATIIDDSIFVTHGGISDTLDLRIVEKLDRHLFDSIDMMSPNANKTSKEEREQVEHLLWNDPQSIPGCIPNNDRNCGVCFGPDVTANFLNRHKLTMLVRSHECVPEGYDYDHNGQMLTIFSASNYYNPNSNLGAYVTFHKDGKADIVQFSSSKAARLSLSRRTIRVEDGALRALRSKIAASKTALVQAFQELDPQNNGSVSTSDWCKVMKKTLKMNLPWRILRPHIAVSSKTFTVLYMTTFAKVEIKSRFIESSGVTEIIYQNKEDMEEIFRIMDKDKSGCISLDEFKECCQILGQSTGQPIPDAEVVAMAKALDLNADGKIDFNEFLEAFRIVNCTCKKGHCQ